MVNFWFRKSTGIQLAGSAATRRNCGRRSAIPHRLQTLPKWHNRFRTGCDKPMSVPGALNLPPTVLVFCYLNARSVSGSVFARALCGKSGPLNANRQDLGIPAATLTVDPQLPSDRAGADGAL